MANEKRIMVAIQFRRGTEAEWAEVDPVLREGEPAYSKDVGRLKVGNGLFKWSELSYIDSEGGSEEIDEELSPISVNPVQNQAITKALQELEDELGTLKANIVYGTTAYWDGLENFIAKENTIYVYTDGYTKDAKNIARFKVGDGHTLLVDVPYTDMVFYDHVNDPIIHITQDEREFWNNKVSCYAREENLVFTTERI